VTGRASSCSSLYLLQPIPAAVVQNVLIWGGDPEQPEITPQTQPVKQKIKVVMVTQVVLFLSVK